MNNSAHRRAHVFALAVVIVTAVLLLPAAVHAQTAPDKFERGLAGMIAGVLELPGNMVRETNERGPGAGLPIGMAKGLGMIVARESVGVYEFLTAPFPVPPGYQPILHPTYPWDYFKRA